MLRPITVELGLPASNWDDVLQEALLAILERLARPDKETIQRWRSWVRRVLRHKATDALRRLHPEIVSLDTVPMEPAAYEGTGIEAERLAWVVEHLEEMAEDESWKARLLWGHFVEGRAYAELAAAEGLTAKAVECRICRYLQELRQKATGAGLFFPTHKNGSLKKKMEKSEKVARDFGTLSD